MPMDQDGDGIDQFGAVMPEFEANNKSPMTLSRSKNLRLKEVCLD